MLKFTADDWTSAEHENKPVRDSARENFWSSIGVKPTSDPTNFDIAPSERLPNMTALLNLVGKKINDAELIASAQRTMQLLQPIAPGSLASKGPSQSFALSQISAWIRKEVFSVDTLPTFNQTRVS